MSFMLGVVIRISYHKKMIVIPMVGVMMDVMTLKVLLCSGHCLGQLGRSLDCFYNAWTIRLGECSTSWSEFLLRLDRDLHCFCPGSYEDVTLKSLKCSHVRRVLDPEGGLWLLVQRGHS